MEQSLEIYNPKQVPFGPLSNNSENMMIIFGKRYPTVTNFIYSNLLTTPLYRVFLQTAPIFPEKKNTVIEDKVRQFALSLESKFLQVDIEKIKKYVPLDVDFSKKSIYELYDYYLRAEYIDAARIALEKAYTAKVNEKPYLADKLQSTENRPIIYDSENTILGVNSKGEGLNLLGRILEQIRYNIQREEYVLQEKEKEDELKEEIFKAYRAYLILQTEILTGGPNLEEYEGLSVEEILEKEQELKGISETEMERVERVIPKEEKEYIFKNYRAIYPFLDQAVKTPGYLYNYMISKNKGFLEEERTKLRKQGIVTGYLRALISIKFPNLSEKEREIASTQLFDSYVIAKRAEKLQGGERSEDFKDYQSVEDKIVESYNKGLFPEKVNKVIKKYLKKLKVYKLGKEDRQDREDLGGDSQEDLQEESQESSQDSQGSQKSDSSDSDDPIKIELSTGNAYLKKRMINYLKTQGKYKKKYEKYSINKLQAKIDKIEKQKEKEDEKDEKMNWVVYGIKPGGRKRLGEYAVKPDRDEMAQLYDWNPARIKIVPIEGREVKVEEDNSEAELEVVEENTQKPIHLKVGGKSILYPFSPTFKSSFTVEGLEYPSVSIYLMCCLVAKTGISIKNELPFRGRNIKEAISLLDDGTGKFVSPDDAAKRYLFYYKETISKMSVLLASIALQKKFEDYYLQTLLLLTRDKTIYWADKNDLVLGGTAKRGQNEVGKILMKLRGDIQGFYIPKSISANDVFNFVKEDLFISSWLNMKIMDMCSTVKKIHTYVTLKGKEVDLDAGFVEQVLDEIYQPCSAVKTIAFKVEDEPTFKFVKMVEKCHGGSVSQDYGKKLDEIKNRITDTESAFWGIQTGRGLMQASPMQKTFEEYLAESDVQLKEFLSTNPTEEQMDDYRRIKSQEVETYFNVPEPKGRSTMSEFEKKQYDDWIHFIDSLFMGIDVDKFEAIQKIKKSKQRKEALSNLVRENLTKEEILNRIKEFIKKQTEEMMVYYDKKGKKTPEELSNHKEIMQELVKEQARIQTEMNKEIAYELDKNMSIARIYWKRLIVMLFFLLTKAKQKNDLDLKKLLIGIIEVASQPASCKPSKFADSETNCIAQGIINLCIGMQSFIDAKEIGKIELDLAKAVILGREFKKKIKKEKVEEEKEEKEEKEDIEESEGEEDEDLEESDEEDEALEDLEEEEEDLEEEENEEEVQRKEDDLENIEDLEFPDVISEEEGEGGTTFGFKSPQKTALNLLQEIWKDADEDIAKKFMKTIQEIKNTRIQPKVKMNRILFFASMR